MNTQDPYRDLSSMKNRDEYPSYDDFVPYRNDWRYGVGIFSVLMIAAIGWASLTLRPEPKAVVTVTAPAVAPNAITNPEAIKTPAAVAKDAPKAIPAKARSKDVSQPKSKPATAPEPAPKPEPVRAVTAPPGH